MFVRTWAQNRIESQPVTWPQKQRRVKAGQNWTQNHAEKANTGAETDDTGPQEQQMVGALAN